MSNPENSPVVSSSAPPSATDQAQASKVVANSSGFQEMNGASTVSSMADFQARSPKLYKAMMKGIAQMLMNDLQNHNNRVIKMMKEGRRQD
jgi:hypothetical protein